ncbi:MAG: flippase-like domain-containing protein [Flexistipes sinusarabici]|uniref:Flippase-like domain-containing protein n=1 Tax=Flexistipes sinusarabici TaxID=2352 RepID=A0A5D0MHW6_FLESI|nr:lysylphosphatidylglycerol synthase transmembrane domain-containing protein [Flexistipes sinusarabici]TYB33267.1 MAG: flippase-like domain-containing protein [Flexistipes sinusarabici]
MQNQTDLRKIMKRIFKWSLLAAGISASVISVILFLNRDGLSLGFIPNMDYKIWYALFFMTFFAWFSKSLRLFTLLKALNYPVILRKSFMISFSSEFAVAATPSGFGGNAVQFAFLKKTGLAPSEILSIVALENLIDIMIFVILFVPVFFVFFGNNLLNDFSGVTENELIIPGLLDNIGIAVIIVLFCVMILLIIALKFKKKLFSFFKRIDLLSEIRKSFSCFKELFRERKSALIAVTFFSFVQWICRYGILPLIAYVLGAGNGVLFLFLIQGIFISIGHLFFLPGGAGGVEIMASSVLAFFLPAQLIGLAVILWRFFTYYMYLLFGGVVFGISIHYFDSFPIKNDKAYL